MDSRQLEFFRVVAKEENITKASEIMFISKQALSKTLLNIEDELGCKLFNRIGKNIYLNNNGKKLLAYADKICDMLDKAVYDLKNSPEEEKPIIIASNIRYLYFLFNQYSTLSYINYIPIAADNDMLLADMLLSQQIFASIDSERSSYKNNYLNKKYIFTERLSILVKKEHPWFSRDSIRTNELEGTTFICDQSDELWFNDIIHHNHLHVLKELYENRFFINAARYDNKPILVLDNIPAFSLEINVTNWAQSIEYKVIPIIDYDPRDIYIWWLPENNEKIKPLLENLDKVQLYVKCT